MNLSKQIVAAILVVSVSMAEAGVITIDDFSVVQGPLVDLSPNNVRVFNVNAVRNMSINGLSFTDFPDNRLEVTGGVLEVTNGAGDDSEVTLTWNIAAGLIPLGSSKPSFLFEVVASDTKPTDVDFFLDGASFGSFVIPGNSSGSSVSFGLAAGALAAFNGGGALELRVNGAPGWNLTLDSISLEFADPKAPTPVSLPGSLALLGLGLVAMRLGRKKMHPLI